MALFIIELFNLTVIKHQDKIQSQTTPVRNTVKTPSTLNSKLPNPMNQTNPDVSKKHFVNVKDNNIVKPRFHVDKMGVEQELALLLPKGDIDTFSIAGCVTSAFNNTFGKYIEVPSDWDKQDDISIMLLAADPAKLVILYPKEIHTDWDQDTVKALGALTIRLHSFQCKMVSIFTIIDNLPYPSHMLTAEQRALVSSLQRSTFKRLPSMLKLLPGEPSANFKSTFKHIAKCFRPLEEKLRELLEVLNVQQFGPGYNPWNSHHVSNILHEYAPEGFTSVQKDLYYILSAIRKCPPLTPENKTQWIQYSKEICNLINILSLYPNPHFDMLPTFMSTQAINLPLNVFFDYDNKEGLSKRAYANFIDRSNRMIRTLWFLLLCALQPTPSKVEAEVEGVANSSLETDMKIENPKSTI